MLVWPADQRNPNILRDNSKVNYLHKCIVILIRINLYIPNKIPSFVIVAMSARRGNILCTKQRILKFIRVWRSSCSICHKYKDSRWAHLSHEPLPLDRSLPSLFSLILVSFILCTDVYQFILLLLFISFYWRS